jgi:predicted HNH restriction endonuclease
VPFKDPEQKRAYERVYRKTHYEKNKASVQARVARNKKLAREKWVEFKASQVCHNCGMTHPAIIDFHHVVRDGTQQSVNRMAADNRWKAIYEEVKKCIPLCSNCHRILHWDESRKKMITKDMTNRTMNRTEESTNDDDSGTV